MSYECWRVLQPANNWRKESMTPQAKRKLLKVTFGVLGMLVGVYILIRHR